MDRYEATKLQLEFLYEHNLCDVTIPLGEESAIVIYRINEDLFVYEIPQYGGEERFYEAVVDRNKNTKILRILEIMKEIT